MSSLLGVASAESVCVFDVLNHENTTVFKSPAPLHGGKAVKGFQWLSSGIFVTCGEDDYIRMLHALQADKEAEFPMPSESQPAMFTCLSTGPERKDVLTGLSDGSVLIWNTKLAQATHTLTAFDSSVSCLEVAGGPSVSDALIIAGSIGGDVVVLTEYGSSSTSLAALGSRAFVKKAAGSEMVALIAESGTGAFYNLDNLSETGSIDLPFEIADLTSFTYADGSFVIGSVSGMVSILESRVAKTRYQFSCRRGVHSVSVNHDDSLVAVGTSGCVEVFDLRNTKIPVVSVEHPGDDVTVSFSKKAFSSQENFRRTKESSQSAKLSFRPPLRDMDLSPALHVSLFSPNEYSQPAKACPEVAVQTDAHVAEAKAGTDVVVSGLGDRLDDQHIDVVARLATLEIELSEIKKDMKAILAALQVKSRE